MMDEDLAAQNQRTTQTFDFDEDSHGDVSGYAKCPDDDDKNGEGIGLE